MRILIVLLISILVLQEAKSQTLPVGSPIVEGYVRRQQLLGKFDPAISFNYRPLTFTKNGISTDSLEYISKDLFGYQFNRPGQASTFTILPIEFRVAQDLQNPDNRNNGAMIRSRGWQTYLAAGFYAELGPLSIQLKPEFIWAQNKEYIGFPDWPRHYESTWQVRYNWFNRIDQPERYGDDPYTKVTWGQSSIRLNKWGMSLGLSTENLWWGPGIRNSIMMSNNAQGFPHITFNTQRPIITSIGAFEWQLITGRLSDSGYKPPYFEERFRGYEAYVPKVDDSRYYQAITFSYSPKWIQGLSFGLVRWVQQYIEDTRGFKSHFPAFTNLFKRNVQDEFGFSTNQDQAAGFFGRWVWADANAEVYFEFHKKNAAINLRDLIANTDHPRALTVGINKLFKMPASNAMWQFNFEWTQTSQAQLRLINDASSWYIHNRIRHGYTHNGEVLGSALGPGGNAQYIEISWIKGFTRIGGAVERYVHNNDFAVAAFNPDFTRYWVDYNLHGFVELKFDKILLSSSLFFTKSLNYQWEVLFDPNDPSAFPDTPGVDRINWNLDIKVSYTL